MNQSSGVSRKTPSLRTRDALTSITFSRCPWPEMPGAAGHSQSRQDEGESNRVEGGSLGPEGIIESSVGGHNDGVCWRATLVKEADTAS